MHQDSNWTVCFFRAVYLSGGVTMLPGFQERLHAELKKMAPPAVTVEVGTCGPIQQVYTAL